MNAEKSKEPVRSYQISVDLLLDIDSNAHALEQLVRLLNSQGIKDFRIQKVIELENTVEEALQRQKIQTDKKDAGKTPAKSEAKKEPAAAKIGPPSALADEIERYKANNTLVRITVVKGKGVKLNIPCRILNYDSSSENVSVYHVDEKKVYLFRLNEIDDLQMG